MCMYKYICYTWQFFVFFGGMVQFTLSKVVGDLKTFRDKTFTLNRLVYT